MVEDILSDKDSAPQQYTVTAEQLIQFPEDNIKIKKGDKLLTVWYEVEQQSWTNILYPCVALEDYPDPDEPESIVVRVQFEGDVRAMAVNTQWMIKFPA